MSRHRLECPTCHVPLLSRRDAAGAYEYVQCPTCRDSAYFADGVMSAFAPGELWHRRHQAKRVFAVLEHIAAERLGPDEGRRAAGQLLRQWLGRTEIGHWHTWTPTDCVQILREASSVLQQLATERVAGNDRVTLHRAQARRSRFPRLTFGWLRWRDRWQARWSPRLMAWIGRVLPSDSGRGDAAD